MRHILTMVLALAVATVAEAATVTGTIKDANGDAVTTRVEFWPLTAPLQSGDALIVTGRPVRTTATDGVLSVSLVEGLYQVRIGSYDKIKISVPSGSGSYEIGTLTADGITYIPPVSGGGITVSLSPTNYTALSTNLETHLAGIDVALAEAGGAVDLTGTNDLASTGTLLNAKLLTAGGILLSTNITDHNTAQYAGALIVSTNIPMTTDWMGQSPYQLVIAGTDGVLALVGTEEGGHTDELEFVQVNDADGSFVDKWAISRLGYADGAALEFLYGATDPYEVYTKATNITVRVYPDSRFQVRGTQATLSLMDDDWGTTAEQNLGLVSSNGVLYVMSWDNHFFQNPFTLSSWNQSGDFTVTGDIANTGTLSVSNNITAYDTPAFGGAIISTTNRTLTASTVLNPAPVQLTLNGTEGALALVGGPEGNFADTIDMVEVSEDGTTLTDKWTLAKRTYSSNSALAFYYGPNAYMGSNTNVYYLSKEGDTWNKRNATVGGDLTVATNGNYGGALTVGYDSDGSNYEYAKLSHDGAGLTTLGGFTAGTGTDAQSLKIQLAGNGALYVDGDTAGNARGANAVDLQSVRNAATQVASGSKAVVFGGGYNTSSGANSSTSGYQNTASGQGSSSIGGFYNTASGAMAFVAGGQENQSTANYSLSSGYRSKAYLYGQQANASGLFSALGDAQGSRLVARNTTSGTTPADLLLDGATASAILPANTSWGFTASIVGRTTDAGTGAEQSAYYKFEGLIKRDGANNTTLVGSVTKTVLAEDDATWDVTVSADDTNEALVISCTGGVGDSVRWVAVIQLVEVGG